MYTYIYIYIGCRAAPSLVAIASGVRKGGVVKGGLAMRHVFNLCIETGT